MPLGLFWEAHQQSRISSAKAGSQRAENKADRLDDRVRNLERKMERMALTSQALWELLRDNTEFNEDDIITKITEIDLRDGEANGRMGHSVMTCPSCQRPSNSERGTCLYCGTPMARPHIFE
ncbi:MAG: hypothetical protein RRC34_14915 [Lentisphaeria bacterium]|nr:hypothetical protein [Lentisphaeria bacterium]